MPDRDARIVRFSKAGSKDEFQSPLGKRTYTSPKQGKTRSDVFEFRTPQAHDKPRQRCEEIARLFTGLADPETLLAIHAMGQATHQARDLDPLAVGRLVAHGVVVIGPEPWGVLTFTPYGRLVWVLIRGLVG